MTIMTTLAQWASPTWATEKMSGPTSALAWMFIGDDRISGRLANHLPQIKDWPLSDSGKAYSQLLWVQIRNVAFVQCNGDLVPMASLCHSRDRVLTC